MSRKTPAPYKSIDNNSVSASIIGAETIVNYKDRIFFTVDYSGTLSGSIIIEHWDDESWKSLDFGSTITISTGSGNHQILVMNATFLKIRPSYVHVSGAGAITVTLQSTTEGA